MSSSEIDTVVSVATGITATRYLAVAGLTMLLYDHVITFERERKYLWAMRPLLVRWIVLSNRYIVPLALIINAHAFMGINTFGLTEIFCKAWWAAVAFISILSIAICHGIIVIKLWQLWEASRIVMWITTIGFIVAESGALLSALLTAVEALPSTHYSPLLSSCILTTRPPALRGVWAFMISFEIFACIMVVINGLSRPRRDDTFLFSILLKDGVTLFLVICVLGSINLVLSITQPSYRAELGLFYTWALSVTVWTRMLINIQDAEEEERIASEANYFNSGPSPVEEEIWSDRQKPDYKLSYV